MNHHSSAKPNVTNSGDVAPLPEENGWIIKKSPAKRPLSNRTQEFSARPSTSSTGVSYPDQQKEEVERIIQRVESIDQLIEQDKDHEHRNQEPPPASESNSSQNVTQPSTDIREFFQLLAKLNFDLSVSVDRSQAIQQFLTRVGQFCNADMAALVGVLEDPISNRLPWSSPKLLGTSNSSNVDRSGSFSHSIENAAKSCLDYSFESSPAEGELAEHQSGQEKNPPRVFNNSDHKWLQPLADSLNLKRVVAVEILGDTSAPAVLILAGNSEKLAEVTQGTLADSLPIVCGPILRNLAKVHQGILAKMVYWPFTVLHSNWKAASVFATLLMALCLIPLPYTLNCDCSLQTDVKRYAVAPFKGKLKEVLVKPGSLVEKDQILARMDDQELNLRLKGLMSDLAKERQISLAEKANGDFGKAKISELKYRQTQNDIQLVKHQLSHLEIRSSIAGTVVQGEIQHLTGAPVDIGQNLLEVAPLDSLVVEIEIPEYQIRYVKNGQAVRLNFEAYPYENWEGKVLRIQPHASVRNHINVFVAEVELQNVDQRLQPGMKGKAKIASDSYPLAWNWLHYPYERLRYLTGWF